MQYNHPPPPLSKEYLIGEDMAIDYELDKMPNGEMLGGVYVLTAYVVKLLDGTNEGFMKAEAAIRNHVWKEAQIAYEAGLYRESVDFEKDEE